MILNAKNQFNMTKLTSSSFLSPFGFIICCICHQKLETMKFEIQSLAIFQQQRFLPHFYTRYLIFCLMAAKLPQRQRSSLGITPSRQSRNRQSQVPPQDNEVDPFMPEKYEIIERICLKNGCDVLKARGQGGQEVAIKVIMSTISPKKIAKEIKISSKINNKYCSKLIDVFESKNHVCLVTNYIKSIPFQEIIKTQTHLVNYLQSLLKAIKHLKKQNILHRDIKPSNFLFNQDKGILIDFGLAEFRSQSKLGFYATQGYEALQVALGVQPYSDSSEMWSVGVIMLQFMTGKTVIFNECIAKKNSKEIKEKQKRQNYLCSFILQLAQFFGKDKIKQQCRKFGYSLTLPQSLPECLLDEILTNQIFIGRYGENQKDLLKKLLELDPRRRITVENALKHQLFKK